MESAPPYLWDGLDVTDSMLRETLVSPLPDPAASIAERLVMMAHRHLNPVEWSWTRSSNRAMRYWSALAENVEAAAHSRDCATWWEEMSNYMLLRPTMGPIAAEKDRLTHPRLLTPSVEDRDVMDYLRRSPTGLVDRARIWSTSRADSNEFLEDQL